MPSWSKLKTSQYRKEMQFLAGDNQIYSNVLQCEMTKGDEWLIVEIWDVNFELILFEETCEGQVKAIKISII